MSRSVFTLLFDIETLHQMAAANASYEILKANNLARTPAGFGTESSHLLSTVMHVANGVVVKMTGTTIANGIWKIYQ
jgi:hypothetical protein